MGGQLLAYSPLSLILCSARLGVLCIYYLISSSLWYYHQFGERKLRHEEAKGLAQGLTSSDWWTALRIQGRQLLKSLAQDTRLHCSPLLPVCLASTIKRKRFHWRTWSTEAVLTNLWWIFIFWKVVGNCGYVFAGGLMSVIEGKDKVHDENLTLVLAHSSQQAQFSH